MPNLYENVVSLLESGEAAGVEAAKVYELRIGEFRRLVVAKDMFEAKRLLSCRKMSKSELITEAFSHTGRKPPLDGQLQLPLDSAEDGDVEEKTEKAEAAASPTVPNV